MTLTVKNLRFAYHERGVLNGVDMVAEPGQCVCVLGANGAGKTTLFRCLLGLLAGYQGDVLFDGISSRRLTAHDMARRIAYVPQAHSPMFNYTVSETVLMGTNAHSRSMVAPDAKDVKTAQDALEAMNIADLADRGFGELSGGERQLVLVARALAQNSDMIVMDEPTANLDYGNQFRVLAEIRRLAHRGYTVLLSTHSPEHALLFGDAVVVLQDGKVSAAGRPHDVLNPATVQSIYGVFVEMQDIQTTWGRVPVMVPKVD